MVCFAAFLLILKPGLGISLHSPWGANSPHKHQHYGFFFKFYFKDRKVALITEQTTFSFPLNPGCPLSVTLCQLADVCLLCHSFPKLRWPRVLLLLLKERWLLRLGSLRLPRILGCTVFFILLTGCCLSLLFEYVSCLVQLRSSNSSGGSVMCRRSAVS